jgi:diacylglycerol kinase family enzyme
MPVTTILFNARAGLRGALTEDRLVSSARALGSAVTVYAVKPTDLSAEIDRLVTSGCATIGVAGGDGTISTAADRLAGSVTALLPIPTGSLNHFARRVGFDEVEAAIRALRDPKVDRISVGMVDDRVFLNTATFGLYAEVVRRRERLRRYTGKWPAALLAFGITLARLRSFDLVVQVEGEYIRRSTPLLWVGLGWGSFPRVHESPERRKSPDLEVVVLRSGTRIASVALLARLIRSFRQGRRPIDDPALEMIHARSLLIHAPRAIEMTMDGEPSRCVPPVFVAVLDEALRVVMPAGA